ncbi:helix-turn-helix transcriptional regulator [Vibrio hepatarius]|uniref:helix-turn-helix transcriptional regulator n=1 Tax=Vibrio hepatarius TaxID=171383 RepID=UPI001C0947BB|nr:AraC family transcriptional regulator [Vibrio hepatarius]MBU2898680.1 AraC family transcriptional regulator [Vibrio hepatarius]
MAYYRLPFDIELMQESTQKNGNIVFKHPKCNFFVRCNQLNDEIILNEFRAQFYSPIKLETNNHTEFDLVTIMINMSNAVCYHINSLSTQHIIPNKALIFCYSDTQSGTCKYQHQNAHLIALQVPRRMLVEYFEVMQIGTDIKNKLKRKQPFFITKRATDTLLRIAKQLIEPSVTKNSLHHHMSYSFINEAVYYLANDDKCKTNHKISFKHLEVAIGILDQEYSLPPTISQLAHRVGTNETSLKQLFRKELNTTVHQYIVQQRMSKAIELLNESPPSVSFVAQEVGYANHGHFSATFKKALGCLPSDYLPSSQPNLNYEVSTYN